MAKIYRLTTKYAGIWQYTNKTEQTDKLPVPNLSPGFGMGGIFFFTEKGYKTFKKINKQACKKAMETGDHVYLLKLELDNIPENNIVYQDKYQIGISYSYFNPNNENICEYKKCIEICK